MGFIDSIRARLGLRAPARTGAPKSHAPLRVAESIGWPDPDAFLEGHQNFRTASGRSVRRVPYGEQQRSLRFAWDEHRQNPMANRIIGMRADYMAGAGITPTSKNEELAGFLKDFWEDPVNNFPLRLHAIASAFRRDGELLGEPLVNRVSGRTRILWHDVASIGLVLPHKTFSTLPGRLRLAWGGKDVEGVVVAPGEAETPWPLLAEGVPGVMFFAANQVIGDGSMRGYGDLYHSLEYILEMDNATFAMLERFNVAIAYLWHVTTKGGANDPEVDHIQSVLRQGKPGDSLYTRPDVTITALSPQLPAIEFSDMLRTVKNLVLGGAGVPEAWFADGDSANRATVVGQSDPTFRSMSRAQSEFKFVLRTCCDFAVARGLEAGLIGPAAAAAEYELSCDPVSKKDDGVLADTLAKLTTILDWGVDMGGAMTRKEAALAFRRMAAPLTGISEELPEELMAAFESPQRRPQVGTNAAPDEDAEDRTTESYRDILRRHRGVAA